MSFFKKKQQDHSFFYNTFKHIIHKEDRQTVEEMDKKFLEFSYFFGDMMKSALEFVNSINNAEDKWNEALDDKERMAARMLVIGAAEHLLLYEPLLKKILPFITSKDYREHLILTQQKLKDNHPDYKEFTAEAEKAFSEMEKDLER